MNAEDLKTMAANQPDIILDGIANGYGSAALACLWEGIPVADQVPRPTTDFSRDNPFIHRAVFHKAADVRIVTKEVNGELRILYKGEA